MNRKRPFRDNQKPMFAYTLKHKHKFIGAEMRLGKTVVIIRSCLLHIPLNKQLGLHVLVVSNNSALGSWQDELDLEGVKWLRLSGERQNRLEQLATAFLPGDGQPLFILTNKESHLYIPELSKFTWDDVVLDEDLIKNPKAKISRYFTQRFRLCPHRWYSTGTPNAESDMEWFTPLQWLDGRAFGYSNYWNWRNENFSPAGDGYGFVPNPGVKDKITQYIAKRCFIQRRKDCNINIPKQHIRRVLELPANLRKQYDEIEATYELPDGTETIFAMQTYMWLRQLCGGFIEQKQVHDIKQQELVYLLQNDLKDTPVVVWFMFNQELDASLSILNKNRIPCSYITGDVKPIERENRRKQWNQGKFNVLLLQQMVASTGTNLSHTDTCIYYSQNPSLRVSKQTADRTLALDKAGLLYIYLLTDNSVDTDLYDALIMKNYTSEQTLNEVLKQKLKERIRQYA